MRTNWMLRFSVLGALLFSVVAHSSDLDEFKVKRQDVFEFDRKPSLKRDGERLNISFVTKGYCDVTVAIENTAGKIVRHLASGVLGPKAPEPFQKDSLEQIVNWDFKDDAGHYGDDPDLIVRVSLGLKPAFERTLFWDAKKRVHAGNRTLAAAAPEGVYVFEGAGVDHLCLFDHKGNYVRTVYPPPEDKLGKIQGLKWAEFPQDGAKLPLKNGQVQATFLTSGENAFQTAPSKDGCAASALAVQDGNLALIQRSMNRLGTDGTSAGFELSGAKNTFQPFELNENREAYPRSAAFSPDGKWVYFTGFVPRIWGSSTCVRPWTPVVMRLEYAGQGDPQVFVGGLKDSDAGTDNTHFRVPTSVAVDGQGLVYVADYMNDRIQVYTPDAKYFKTIPTNKPASITVHPRTGEIYVSSWMLTNRFFTQETSLDKPTFTRLSGVKDAKVLATCPLPLSGYSGTTAWNENGGLQHDVYVDCYAEPPTLWVLPGTAGAMSRADQFRYGSDRKKMLGAWAQTGLCLYIEKDGKLCEQRNFGADVEQSVVRARPPAEARPRLYVNPATGLLYVAEGDSGVSKSFRELVEIDPTSGKTKIVPLPWTAEDIDFDLSGCIYLRTDTDVVRYEYPSFREIPFDYGEEREQIGFEPANLKITSSIPLPATRPGCFHLGGFCVSPRGHVVASCYNPGKQTEINIPGIWNQKFTVSKPYTPPSYPGRLRWAEIHAWDQHGKLLHPDLVQGLSQTDGLAMDRDDNIYVMVAANRVLNGKAYFLGRSETLMKFKPKAGRVLSSSKDIPQPLGESTKPSVSPQLEGGFGEASWVEGVEWLFGGVGFGGFNQGPAPSCACWNARFSLDLFARSFAPEVDHFSVAVLDTNGNLILRIGRYGNVDDGKPVVLEGGPANPRSIGGDEVALFHAPYLSTQTDRRLFIADVGNSRILSVKLGYHAEEKLRVKDAPEAARQH